MDAHVDAQAEERVQQFFAEARSLDRKQVRRLRKEGRSAPTRLALETEPDFLAAVSTGAWTSQHDLMARQIRRDAEVVAKALSPLLGRRAVAKALAAAALVVMTDSASATALPGRLRARLLQPWSNACADVGSAVQRHAA